MKKISDFSISSSETSLRKAQTFQMPPKKYENNKFAGSLKLTQQNDLKEIESLP